MWVLDPQPWEWSKVKKSGMPPGPRAGLSMCVHKKRSVLFGGIVELEMEGDVMMSLFLNELHGFQLDNYRWYPLELQKEKSTIDKLKKSSQQMCNGYNGDKINAMEIGYTPNEDANQDYLRGAATDAENVIDEISDDVKTNMALVDHGSSAARFN